MSEALLEAYSEIFLANSFVKPAKLVSPEEEARMRLAAYNLLIDMIRRDNKNPENYIVVDLRMTDDLGLGTVNDPTVPVEASSSSSDWKSMVSRTVDESKYIVIYKVEYTDPTPVITMLKFRTAGKTLGVVDLTQIWREEPRYKAVFINPLIGAFKAKSEMYIDYLAKASDTEEIKFVGFVAIEKSKIGLYPGSQLESV